MGRVIIHEQKQDLRTSALFISKERALGQFYSTETYRQISDSKYSLQLMSDGYIVKNALSELRDDECFVTYVTTYAQGSWSV